MKKSGSNALWNKLSPEHRELLDEWHFEQNLSCAEAWPRAQAELGFQGSVSSLKRYYQRRSDERVMEEVAEEAPGDVKVLRLATMKLVAAQAFQQVRETPDEVEKWGPAVKLMVENDRNETTREGHRIRKELRAEDQEIRREAREIMFEPKPDKASAAAEAAVEKEP